MAMDKKIITELGDELYNALKNRQVIDPLSSRYPDMTVEEKDKYARMKCGHSLTTQQFIYLKQK